MLSQKEHDADGISAWVTENRPVGTLVVRVQYEPLHAGDIRCMLTV